MLDLRKKDIDPFERAQVIGKYLEDTGLSQRQLAKDLGLPHSTVQDWLLWNRIDNDQYLELKDKNMRDTDIYRMLRNNKKEKVEILVETSKFQYEIENAIKQLSPYVTDTDTTRPARALVERLQELCSSTIENLDK